MKCFSFVVALLLLHTAYAQQPDSSRMAHFVFPGFIKGAVAQKNGHREEALMNYNSVTQEMVFVQNGNYLALSQLENIDTIYLGGRKFIPVKDAFYEVATDTRVPLYINYHSNLLAPGKPAGYGASSEAGSIDNVSQVNTKTQLFRFRLPEDYKVVPETEFFLKKDNDFIRIYTVKQVTKLFPGRADAIQDFVRKNKTNFKNPDDMTRLIRFCNES